MTCSDLLGFLGLLLHNMISNNISLAIVSCLDFLILCTSIFSVGGEIIHPSGNFDILSRSQSQFSKSYSGTVRDQIDQPIVLQNEYVELQFGPSKGNQSHPTYGYALLQVISRKGIGAPISFLEPENFSIWKMQLVDSKGPIEIDSSSVECQPSYDISKNSTRNSTTLELHWNHIHISGNVAEISTNINVTVSITIVEGDPVTYWRPSVVQESPQFGLWKFTMQPLNKLASPKVSKEKLQVK